MRLAPRNDGLIVRTLLATGLLVASSLAAPGATAAEAAGCTASQVAVVVDYGPYPGSTVTGCVTDPSSGAAALQAAGFTITGVIQQPGFVCRLNGVPPSSDDPCVVTPPTTAYWAYWHATSGGWTFSTVGAYSYVPRAGSAEGWAFGAGVQPGIAPPLPQPPLPQPPLPQPPLPLPPTTSAPPPPVVRPTAAPPPISTPGGGSTPTTTSAATTATTWTATTRPPDTSQTPTTASSAPETSKAVAGATSATRTDTAVPLHSSAAADPPGGGPPWSLLLALFTVLALGGGAWWQVRRRR